MGVLPSVKLQLKHWKQRHQEGNLRASRSVEVPCHWRFLRSWGLFCHFWQIISRGKASKTEKLGESGEKGLFWQEDWGEMLVVLP
jgi:hypothetical protein